jgi:ATP-binding cassette subfamily B protein RaxB
MDEGTSHLDAAREAAINGIVGQMGISRIIIAHRAETILAAERIMVVERGTIAPVVLACPSAGTSEPPTSDTLDHSEPEHV